MYLARSGKGNTRRVKARSVHAPARRLARTTISLGPDEGIAFGLRAVRYIDCFDCFCNNNFLCIWRGQRNVIMVCLPDIPLIPEWTLVKVSCPYWSQSCQVCWLSLVGIVKQALILLYWEKKNRILSWFDMMLKVLVVFAKYTYI